MDQSALLRGKPYARKGVSAGNTLFWIELEYWTGSFTVTFCA